MPEEYVCTLNAADLAKAKKELGEDPDQRQGAVDALRTWVEQQPHLAYPTDNHSLIQMLRYAKFSQLRAREVIENYCKMKSEHPEWFHNWDPNDKIVDKYIKDGVVLTLPLKGKKGENIVIWREGAYTPSEWKDCKDELIKCFYMQFVMNLYDEDVQVNGTAYFSDMTGVTMAHHTFWTVDEMKSMMHAWQKVIPNRYTAFYHYNINAVFELMMELIRPFLTKKMKERMKTVGNNMEDVYKIIPKENLPVEYLPDDYTGPNAGTIQSMIDKELARMRSPEMVAYLKYISDPKWGYDKSKKQDDVPVASFRKLNVD